MVCWQGKGFAPGASPLGASCCFDPPSMRELVGGSVWLAASASDGLCPGFFLAECVGDGACGDGGE